MTDAREAERQEARNIRLRAAFGNLPRARPRTSEQVLSDRLGDASAKWAHQFTGEERDAIALLRSALDEIDAGLRGDKP